MSSRDSRLCHRKRVGGCRCRRRGSSAGGRDMGRRDVAFQPNLHPGDSANRVSQHSRWSGHLDRYVDGAHQPQSPEGVAGRGAQHKGDPTAEDRGDRGGTMPSTRDMGWDLPRFWACVCYCVIRFVAAERDIQTGRMPRLPGLVCASEAAPPPWPAAQTERANANI